MQLSKFDIAMVSAILMLGISSASWAETAGPNSTTPPASATPPAITAPTGTPTVAEPQPATDSPILGVMYMAADGRWDAKYRHHINSSYQAQPDYRPRQVITDWTKLLKPEAVRQLSDDQKRLLLSDPYRLVASRYASQILVPQQLLLIYLKNGHPTSGMFLSVKTSTFELISPPEGVKHADVADCLIRECLKRPDPNVITQVSIVPNDKEYYHSPDAAHLDPEAPETRLASPSVGASQNYRPCRICFTIYDNSNTAAATAADNASIAAQTAPATAQLDCAKSGLPTLTANALANPAEQAQEIVANNESEITPPPVEDNDDQIETELMLYGRTITQEHINELSNEMWAIIDQRHAPVEFCVVECRQPIAPFTVLGPNRTSIFVPRPLLRELRNEHELAALVASQLFRQVLGLPQTLAEIPATDAPSTEIELLDGLFSLNRHNLNVQNLESALMSLENKADQEGLVTCYLLGFEPKSYTSCMTKVQNYVANYCLPMGAQAANFTAIPQRGTKHITLITERLDELQQIVDKFEAQNEKHLAAYMFDNARDVIDNFDNVKGFVQAYEKLQAALPAQP